MKRDLNALELMAAAEATDEMCEGKDIDPRTQIETFGQVIDVLAEEVCSD